MLTNPGYTPTVNQLKSKKSTGVRTSSSMRTVEQSQRWIQIKIEPIS